MVKGKTACLRRKAFALTLPYFALCGIFLVLPLAALVAASFSRGLDSLQTVLSSRIYMRGLMNSLILSASVAVEASVIGGALAITWAKKIERNNWFMAYLNFAANNGGVTLAFAVVSTLGSTGFVTLIMKKFGIDLYPGFDVVSLTGLNLAYLCFLVPYMALLFMPACVCLRVEWEQAAKVLGAWKRQYVMRIAGPVLLPSFLSSACLVFLTALGTYSTAAAISADRINLITLQIGYLMQVSIFKQADAYTISTLLLLIMAVVVWFYRKANEKAGRWLR